MKGWVIQVRIRVWTLLKIKQTDFGDKDFAENDIGFLAKNWSVSL